MPIILQEGRTIAYMYRLRSPKWKFNVFVTMGQVFLSAVDCCLRDIFAVITSGNKFYKNTFSLFWYCALFEMKREAKIRKKNTAAREKHFTIQSCLVITCFMCSPSPRDVSITMWCNHGQKRAHRQFRNANCVDRSMMDWKMIVAKFLWMLCKASNFIGTRLRKNVDSQQIIAIEFVWKWNNFKIISVNKLEIEVLPWKALKRHVLPCQQTFLQK